MAFTLWCRYLLLCCHATKVVACEGSVADSHVCSGCGKGYRIENLNLTQTSSIPDNTDVLLLASPKVPLLPGEIDLLREYIDRIGWLLVLLAVVVFFLI